MDLEPFKEDIVTASRILHQQGIAAAFGHVSARIPGTDTFIFPPRMSPALVRKDNLLVLDVDGNQLSGEGRPNTEFWIHARIYKARPDVPLSAGKPRYFTPAELEVIYPQVSREEVSDRAWEYFSSLVNG